MGKVNICLKWSSICVIAVIAVISILLLGLALLLHGFLLYDEQAEDAIMGVHFLYGFTSVTLILALFGGFGALKQKKWALIVFIIGMTSGCLVMVVNEILTQAVKTKLENHIRNHYLNILPQTNATKSDLAVLDYAQRNLQCCGVEQGYMDWKNNIPESCLCNSKSTNLCVVAPKGSYQFTVEGSVEDQSVMIYAKPCLSIIIAESMFHLNVQSGIKVGFILLWMLSIGLCIAILCQMNKKLETPAVVYSKEAKAGNYSCLIEPPNSCTD
ncbi:tetraspanin-8-like isoform X1 [Girardinichthys multiradiatus]|uniref:tetraspanin-8-like isoform X1 n=1 Tax=Girardinichthys multiradiatus TaxID=208333 RepID=UPI001FABFDC6|nr:tetraspanin-8-like isoform X1 [Girardinichthys multiradiatus]